MLSFLRGDKNTAIHPSIFNCYKLSMIPIISIPIHSNLCYTVRIHVWRYNMNEKVNKPVVFHRNDPEDMELYEWLQRNLIKGEFTLETKAYWKKRYEDSKKEDRK